MFLYNDLILLEDSKPIMYANKCIMQEQDPQLPIISFIWSFVVTQLTVILVASIIFLLQINVFFGFH